MPPSTIDSSPEVTPKIEPQDLPFPAPVSQSSTTAHSKRSRDESNNENTAHMSAGSVNRNLGKSMLTPNRVREEVERRRRLLLSRVAGTGITASGSSPEPTPSSTGAQDPQGSALGSRSPSTEVQNEGARPFNEYIDHPERALHGPRLRVDALDDLQRRIVHKATQSDRNLCIVGGAGTGKSVTCEILLDEMRDRLKNITIVTPSGTSAVNVYAQTLHSFFGLGGKSNKGIDEYKDKMKTCTVEKLQKLDTSVIDEISMVSYEMFDRMNEMCKAARDDDRPFGNIQIIVFGDFCQLPPVKPHQHCYDCGREREAITVRGRKDGKKGEKTWVCNKHGNIKDSNKMWVFKFKQWGKMEFEYLPLSTGHRQADPEFLKLLNKLRHGHPFSRKDIALLLDHPSDAMNAVQLVSKRAQAQGINDNRFNSHELREAQAQRYECRDDFRWKMEAHPELADINQNVKAALIQHPYEQWVRLKVGQPVILQKNLDVQKGLVNGSQGIIIDFVMYDQACQPRDLTRDAGEIAQLRRNYVLDFICGQGYPNIPLVKFHSQDEPVTVYPDCSVSERGFKKPHSLLIRTQIPLLPGWAMTIHKAQGMTLQKAVVHLDHCWQSGMAYVALSRVKNLEGLKVMGLRADHFNHAVDEQVKTFLEEKFGENFDAIDSDDQ